ncbi:ATP-dependent Clp protease adapter ClpS [Nesterenkonia sp. MY13]|uniref:ATP-dependent Clp protease adapter protein ClpS n=1 Tax=Nesterenkonia sedimenti TaxID=1463632 RepID=A0A7X8TLG4_9MICC|nr:ATP-dependent Clp protease adapter ClpS [Nesterenkonia sedimenti]NLS10547.1 ATP-dependent Clp protease adapter ClpS [Nesterenkonia sedimenti]
MSSTAGSTLTREEADLSEQQRAAANRPYQVVVWNDPVNLMSYVAWVFRSYFGHSKEKAKKLMLQVHHEGRAVVATGPREQAERDVTAMHNYGLQATVEEAE